MKSVLAQFSVIDSQTVFPSRMWAGIWALTAILLAVQQAGFCNSSYPFG